MDLDDQLRPAWGIGVSVRETTQGLRVAFDTLQRTSGDGPAVWRMWSFVTHGDVEAERFLKHQLSEAEYAAIGQTLCASLVAVFLKEKAAPGPGR